MSKPTRHCHQCGWEWSISGLPGRNDSCHQCKTDMRVCRNCVSYDTKSAYQCRDKRAEPVFEKASANYCEYFDFIRGDFVDPGNPNSREDKAREQLKKLFGD